MDKEKLIDKIKNLQGLTNDEKADLLGLLRSFKKYGLVWEEKLEEVEERLREEIPVLTEVKERAIISDSADAPNHILIEGDNLEALTTLSYTHEGAIDVIYIDPPYMDGIYQASLENLPEHTVVILEHIIDVNLSEFEIIKQKKYGDKFITFIKRL